MKRDHVYREILYNVFEKKNNFLTQRALAGNCFTSIGNVNHALKSLEKMNAIEKKAQGFKVINPKKILLYWASVTKLQPIYETHVDKSVMEIEKSMPPVLFTAFSGYKFLFKSIPAEYNEIYVYAEKEKIEERFQKKEGPVNLIVLKLDEHLEKFKKISIAQVFVDLWNIDKWYAQDFLDVLERKINVILKGSLEQQKRIKIINVQ